MNVCCYCGKRHRDMWDECEEGEKEMDYEKLKRTQVRVSCTAREQLFTVGMTPYLFDVLGGFNSRPMVSVAATIVPGGLKIKIRKNPKGTQRLRNINHDEVGLRINSKMDNPIGFPFKSFRIAATAVNEDDGSVELFLPSSKIKRAKPRGQQTAFLFDESKGKGERLESTEESCEPEDILGDLLLQVQEVAASAKATEEFLSALFEDKEIRTLILKRIKELGPTKFIPFDRLAWVFENKSNH